MAAQSELAELKEAVEEISRKMDKHLTLVQILIDLCLRDERAVCCHKASKASIQSTTVNPIGSRLRSQPRKFSTFEVSLSSVMEKLFRSGHLRPLAPTPLPKMLPASFNANNFCAFHQMLGHPTDACFRLRHEIQDLIDNGTIQAPPPSKLNAVSNSCPQHKSDPLVGQTSINSTQFNPSPTQINPSHHITPQNQPKPTVPILSEPEVGVMNVGCEIEDGVEFWNALAEELVDQAKEQIVWLKSADQGSTE